MNTVIEKNGNDTTAFGGFSNFLLCRYDIVAVMK
jgi:hypothetical protein